MITRCTDCGGRMPVETIVWVKDHIRIIDQTCLPEAVVFLDIRDAGTLAEAVKNLRVRGAPAIGIAGAMGVALAACSFRGRKSEALVRTARETMEILGGTRPTAVNLFWALERMEKVLRDHRTEPVPSIRKALIREALAI
jgi:methylthioribose-1-phosphate isomerase